MVYAYDISSDWQGPKINNLATLLNVILPILMIGAGIAVLFMSVAGGFFWITAGDSAENVQKAKNYFLYAIIGLVIIAFSYTIVKLFGNILGVTLPL